MSGRTPGRNAPANRDQGPGARRQRGGSLAAGGAAVGTALAVTGAALAVTFAATATAVTPASASWRIVKRVPSGALGDFTAIVAVGRTGGWAFNGISRPTAWKRSGPSWVRVSFPRQNGEEVVAAGASSATNVWAFTASGGRSRALRWSGSHWSVQRSFAAQVGGAVAISPSDLWAFGQPAVPGRGLGPPHYNGDVWSPGPSAPRPRRGRRLP